MTTGSRFQQTPQEEMTKLRKDIASYGNPQEFLDKHWLDKFLAENRLHNLERQQMLDKLGADLRR